MISIHYKELYEEIKESIGIEDNILRPLFHKYMPGEVFVWTDKDSKDIAIRHLIDQIKNNT